MCNMRASMMTFSRVPHVPRDDYWGRVRRRGRDYGMLSIEIIVACYVTSTRFAFVSGRSTRLEEGFLRFCGYPNLCLSEIE